MRKKNFSDVTLVLRFEKLLPEACKNNIFVFIPSEFYTNEPMIHEIVACSSFSLSPSIMAKILVSFI